MNSLSTPSFVVYRRYLAAIGSLMAGLSVAMSAYAFHAAAPDASARLLQAAVFAFLHGLALTALAPLAQRPTSLLALAMLLLGVLLFSWVWLSTTCCRALRQHSCQRLQPIQRF